MIIDHIGIVVRSLDQGIRQWETVFGYAKSSEIVTNSRQKVRVVFLSKTDSLTVKLVEPSDASSSVFPLARRGGGLHHVCFRCDDLGAEVGLLREKGARLVVPPEPGEAFCGNQIAFVLVENNLNIELIDTAEKAGWSGAA